MPLYAHITVLNNGDMIPPHLAGGSMVAADAHGHKSGPPVELVVTKSWSQTCCDKYYGSTLKPNGAGSRKMKQSLEERCYMIGRAELGAMKKRQRRNTSTSFVRST